MWKTWHFCAFHLIIWVQSPQWTFKSKAFMLHSQNSCPLHLVAFFPSSHICDMPFLVFLLKTTGRKPVNLLNSRMNSGFGFGVFMALVKGKERSLTRSFSGCKEHIVSSILQTHIQLLN